MSDQVKTGPVRTARADVLLASVGERGVLCDFYSEDASDIFRDLLQEADGTAEAQAFASRIHPGAGPVLELAAGAGRLTLPLLALGWEVTALELSTAMIEILRERLANGPADLRNRCTVVRGDMTAFALGRCFDTVLLSPGTIDLLTDAERPGLYAAIREHLAPGGQFLLGMTQPEAAKSEPVERAQQFSGRSGRRYVLHARLFPAEGTREVTIYPADETADPFVICSNRFRVLRVEQIVRELEQTGFEVTGRTPISVDGPHNNEIVLAASVRGDSS